MHNPYIKTSPSVHQENPKITKTIGKNEEKPNVEIESGELVLKNDLSGVYKAIPNNKHYQGGVKTYLPEGSFVFSDDHTLALDEDDHDIFEIKKPSKFTQKNNTPAKVLQRNFKPEEYNAMVDKISDVKTDDITKKTAGLMLSKYEDVLGKIAFIQEGKKNFPNDIPEFAQDVAPVYDTQVKNKIMEQKQYMKKGGFVNPYEKMQIGGKTKQYPASIYGPDYTNYVTANPENFILPPTGVPTTLLGTQHYNTKDDSGTYGEHYNTVEFAKRHAWYFGDIKKGEAFNGIDFQNAYNKEAQRRGLNPYFVGKPDENFRAADGKFGKYTYNAPAFKPQSQQNTKEVDTPWLPKKASGDCPPGFYFNYVANRCMPNVVKEKEQIPPVAYDPLKVPPNRMEPITHSLNPYQRANLFADGLQYMGVRQEFPYRSQIQSPLVELERQNPQSALTQNSNATSQAFRNNSMLNPYMTSGNNSQTHGQSMDAMNQTQAQYDNQNSQIANQQNTTNNGIQRQDQQYNVGTDQQYYKESVEGRKNYNDLKDVAFNNLRGDFNTYVGENQSLAYSMAQTPYAPYKYNFKTGQFELTGNRQILDSNSSVGKDAIEEQIRYINNTSATEDVKIREINKLFLSKQLGPMLLKKKGGMIKNPYSK